jgi:glyoxylase-like metal-dependent hydrolase (beta-lactamase superfamily II)/rhodanese-related sulfurtransferase
MIDIIPIDTPSLGDRSYIAGDGVVAIVIDPQRDIDRVLAITRSRGLRITHVLETHIHNDYVTGGYVLARQVGADYVLSADEELSFDRRAVRDGDVLQAGSMRIRVFATPGHTFHHLAYAVEADGEVHGVFSGGSLLYGSTGRPDLLGTQYAEALAREQYRSAQRLTRELPAETRLYPTHGFGSFCSATQAEGTASTLGAEAKSNPVLTHDEEAFVTTLLGGLDAYPAYYAHMGRANAAGPRPADLSTPEPTDPAELRRRIEAGEWVVDLRTRTAFAAGHLPGSLNFGLDGGFVTYLGWVIPWGTPVTLLGSTPEDVAGAQRDLVRIGIDRPAAAATGTPEQWAGGAALAEFPAVTFADLQTERQQGRTPTVLDVRRNDERRKSSLIGSLHIPLHELPARLDEVPGEGPVWVHCAAGYRASIAAGLLDRAGLQVVLIDDDHEQSEKAGLPVTSLEDSSW